MHVTSECYRTELHYWRSCNPHCLDSEIEEWIHQHVPPDLLFGRTQLSELPKIKDRAVHGRCFALILLEGLFAQPFLEQVLLRKPMSFATGIDLAELSTLLMRFTSGLKCWALTGLHSTKEFPLLNFKQPLMCSKNWLEFPDSTTRIIFKLVLYAFIYSRIALPNSELLVLRGIIPFGSVLTAILDTIVNLNRLHHLFKSYNIED